ncbi:hypothetical protein R5R35_000593 [Gryllus longicercus]|uniref:Rab-GAP TBC domain-containing protein n=1 Tax=Gryllus longicercus TaxID=2509291 RepID=A0AAN9VDN9_9ORTH
MENELENTSLSQAEKKEIERSTPVPRNDKPVLHGDVKTPSSNICETESSKYSVGSNQGDTNVTPNARTAPTLEGSLPIAMQKKIQEIENALSEEPINKEALKELAKSEGGLISDALRKRVWPLILDIDTRLATCAPSQEELEAHEEYKQVVMDVNRSLKRFPPNIPSDQITLLQDQLTRLIMRVIIKHPQLRYYQGYHDVAVTFLLVVGEDVAFQIMEKLSTGHFKDYMEPTMDETSYLLNFVYPLIQRMNPALFEYMERAEVGTIFCLEWPLTWYGHSLKQYRDIVRLYDYFLVSPPLLPLYLAAAMVVHRQDEIFAEECDMACIHNLLSKIPDGLPFESLLKQANSIYEKYPPLSIEAEVKERFEEELRRRRGIQTRPRAPVPFHPRWQWQQPWNRFVPHWIAIPVMGAGPRVRVRVILLTATMVGLYAWLRMAEAVPVDGSLSVR